MGINTAFNVKSNLGQPSFDGDLKGTFDRQAANDPDFADDMAPQDIAAAREALAGITNKTSYGFGNNPGMAAQLDGLAIATTEAPATNAPAFKQEKNF